MNAVFSTYLHNGVTPWWNRYHHYLLWKCCPCICLWVGWEVMGGVFTVFPNSSVGFLIIQCVHFPQWLQWHARNHLTAYLPRCHCHTTMAATKAPQFGVQWVCDARFLIAGEAAGVGWKLNGSNVQSGSPMFCSPCDLNSL